MANYKRVTNSFVTFSGITKPFPEDQAFKILYYAFVGGSVEKSLFDQEDALVYIVPTGKTFKMIGFNASHASNTLLRKWYQGDTINAITTFKLDWTSPGYIGNSDVYAQIDFAADKYVTFDPLLAGINWIQAVGYEE